MLESVRLAVIGTDSVSCLLLSGEAVIAFGKVTFAISFCSANCGLPEQLPDAFGGIWVLHSRLFAFTTHSFLKSISLLRLPGFSTESLSEV